jgi:hypothetical protein
VDPMDRIFLKKNDMEVTLLYPGKVYKRSRFDWNGIIEQVSVCNTPFLGLEADGEYVGTEGIGLSSEFGIKTPLSYWKTLPGKPFMKIGVGALIRDSFESYDFFHDYHIKPFETKVLYTENRVEFLQRGCKVGNLNYDYLKAVEILDRELIIHYHLINRGKAVINTEEYCHNFINLGGKNLSMSVTVETSHTLKSRKTIGDILIDSRKVSFSKDPDKTFYMNSLYNKHVINFSWKINCEQQGLSVTGIEDFPVSSFALWGMRHVISPETFHSFSLKPGEDLKWNRRYCFKV